MDQHGNIPNTALGAYEGRHVNPELMKITLPAGYTPAYFLPDEVHGIHVPMVQPGTSDGGNEWLVIGVRPRLIRFANTVAHMYFDCATPVH